MYLISCRHCDAIYKEQDERRHTIPGSWHQPPEDIPYCPECLQNAEDNMEATPEQIKQYNPNQETNQ